MKNYELQKILKSFPKEATVLCSGTPAEVRFYQNEKGKWFIELNQSLEKNQEKK